MCVITDKPFDESSEERWEDARAKNMQEVAEDREVVTPPRKKVSEEVEEIQKVFEKRRHDDEGGGRASTSQRTAARKQPPLSKHAAGVWEAASASDAWRATPLTPILIRNEDAWSCQV